MKVRIIGDAPAAAVLTGLLAAGQQEVVWNPDADGEHRFRALKRRKEIRLNLPWGWVRTGAFQLSSSPLLKSAEVGLAAFRSGGILRGRAASSGRAVGGRNKTLLVLNGEDQAAGAPAAIVPGTEVIHGLSLLDAVEWDPGFVEVASPQPGLLVQSEADLGELEQSLKSCGVSVRHVEDLRPYRHALQIRDLLALPVALCHSTLRHFLSYPEGREIALSLLEEALQLYSYRSLPLAAIPFPDPRDLLQKLKRKPQEFDKARNDPDRAYGPGLQQLLHGDTRAARLPHQRILSMSSQTGIDPTWNWAVAQKVNRAVRVGFFRDPVELYNALQ
jgi:hypothetical protein